MKTYRVYFETTASLSIDVKLTDEEIEAAGGDVNAAAIEKAEDNLPSDVCGMCAGFGQHWSRDFGEWELQTEHKIDDEGNVYFVEIEPKLVENES